jgi:hypothetical protein
MLSQSTPWSRPWKTKRPKLLPKQSTTNGFVNLASLLKFTLMVGKSVNKLSNELFQLLNIQHTKTTLGHPQCNVQVEVFNKTVKMNSSSFVDNTTLGLGKLPKCSHAVVQHQLPLQHHPNTI